MKMIPLLQHHIWAPGACWRCGTISQVAVIGTIGAADDGGAVDLDACGVCVLRLDALRFWRAERLRRHGVPGTPEELAAYHAPAAHHPDAERELRQWIESLMVPLSPPVVSSLVYGVHGQVSVDAR